MGKNRIKPNYRRRVLRLPDLDHCKTSVLNSLGSPASRRVYEYAIDQFVAWYCSEPRRFGFYDFASGQTRKILTIQRPVDNHIAVSPDGRTILYPQSDESGSVLMLVDNFR
jgi:hypothetical protein